MRTAHSTVVGPTGILIIVRVNVCICVGVWIRGFYQLVKVPLSRVMCVWWWWWWRLIIYTYIRVYIFSRQTTQRVDNKPRLKHEERENALKMRPG
jgi:hypothetical protein